MSKLYLEFLNCYLHVKNLNQDMLPIDKLYQTYESSYTLKKNQLCKVMCYTIKALVANRHFFAVFWFGSGLGLTSPRSKSKLHVNHK